MDLSSLPQSQQQQIQQLYQQFQDYQGQQQPEQLQQQHDYTSQPQDPSQCQSYQPWMDYPYYQQYHQNPQQPQPDFSNHNQQLQIPYYANAYQPHQQLTQTESVPVQPPRVPDSQQAIIEVNSRGTLGQGQVQIQHLPNANYPQRPNLTHAPGLNPAAAAAVEALSQLTQFAGTMGAAERAMSGIQGAHLHGLGPTLFDGGPGPVHPSMGHYLSYGGRTGGRAFESSGGGFHPRPFFGTTARGRGRGRRGGPPRIPMPRGTPKPSQPESSTAATVNAESSKGEGTRQSVGEKAPKVGCELCNVDCVTAEILEQHRNGKKHKKMVQKTEESKNVKAGTEGEAKPEVDGSRRGVKRRAQIGRPPKGGKVAKVVIPFMCDLCNVKCDTQEVLNCHLTGKKHNAKLKKFEDHGSRFGPFGLQSLYPPNPMAQQQPMPAVLPSPYATPAFPPYVLQQHAPQPHAGFQPQPQAQVQYNNITPPITTTAAAAATSVAAVSSELLNVGNGV